MLPHREIFSYALSSRATASKRVSIKHITIYFILPHQVDLACMLQCTEAVSQPHYLGGPALQSSASAAVYLLVVVLLMFHV
jgi:hypothetical protein